MYVDITTAIASIKTMTEFVTLAARSKTDRAVAEKAKELNAVIISLQATVLSIQAQHHEAIERNHELEQKIVEMNDWKATAIKYRLTEVETGVFVYTIKPEEVGVDPQHWLCTRCYEDKKKSILQRGRAVLAGCPYSCPRCAMQIIV